VGPRTLARQPMTLPGHPKALPRHARPVAAGRWAGRIAERGLARPSADAEAARPITRRHDPLLDPLAVTEHCFICDQIRLPAARCDIVGCGAEFADLAALGEADNRARALVAGWRVDAFGQLVCPACQQRHGATRQRMPGPEPDPGGLTPPGPRDGGSPSVRAKLAGWRSAVSPGAVSPGRHRRAQWLHMLTALASGTNGWSAAQPVTGPAPEGTSNPAALSGHTPPSARPSGHTPPSARPSSRTPPSARSRSGR
jgi:hypothetical protein